MALDISFVGGHRPLIPFDFEESDIQGTVKMLDPSKIGAAACAAVTLVVENGPVRYRVDGGDPSATVGEELFDRDRLSLSKAAGKQLKLVRTGVTNGFYRATYWRE